MNLSLKTVCILALTLTMSALTPTYCAEPDALQILNKADDKLDIKNTKVEFEMLVYRNKELRKTYRMSLMYQDADHTLVETHFPPRNEGEKMLQAGRRNYWLFLPNINRSMRISEANNFSSSDFSNSDILSPRLSNEYKPQLRADEKINEEDCYTLELIAKDESTAYAKIIYWIRKQDFFPIRRDYYTFSQQLLKRLDITSTTQALHGKPDTFMMSSVLERDKQTVLRYLKTTADQHYQEDSFHPDTLMKR